MIWFDFNRCKLIIFCATSTAVFISIAAFCHLWNMFKRQRKSKKVAAHQEVGQDNNAGHNDFHLLLPTTNPQKWDKVKANLLKLQRADCDSQLWRGLARLNSSAERGLLFFYKNYATDEEKTNFLSIIQTIAGYAASLEDLLLQNSDPIVLKQAGVANIVNVNRKLAAACLAHSLFCLHPEGVRTNSLPHANFTGIYATINHSPPREKLRCWLHYFERLGSGEYEHLNDKSISFERVVVAPEDLLTYKHLSATHHSLCPLSVGIYLENVPATMAKVDFANMYLGGGVLGQGCVQEEIMFAVCPELVVGMLFEEVMRDSEAIVISGYERFCSYRGYGHSFAYDGDFRDQFSKQNVVVAIDAIPFRYGNLSPDAQYEERYMLREINKAYAGFKSFGRQQQQQQADEQHQNRYNLRSNNREVTKSLIEPARLTYPHSIATGNWGCGAFGGDAQLKCLLQWLVASYVGCEELHYCTFAQEDLDMLEMLAAKLQQCSVAHLADLLRQYSNRKVYRAQPVFDFIASTFEHQFR